MNKAEAKALGVIHKLVVEKMIEKSFNDITSVIELIGTGHGEIKAEVKSKSGRTGKLVYVLDPVKPKKKVTVKKKTKKVVKK